MPSSEDNPRTQRPAKGNAHGVSEQDAIGPFRWYSRTLLHMINETVIVTLLLGYIWLIDWLRAQLNVGPGIDWVVKTLLGLICLAWLIRFCCDVIRVFLSVYRVARTSTQTFDEGEHRDVTWEKIQHSLPFQIVCCGVITLVGFYLLAVIQFVEANLSPNGQQLQGGWANWRFDFLVIKIIEVTGKIVVCFHVGGAFCACITREVRDSFG